MSYFCLLCGFTEKDAALKQVEGFETTTPPNYRAHLVSVAGKTYKRTHHQRVGSNTHPDQVNAEQRKGIV